MANGTGKAGNHRAFDQVISVTKGEQLRSILTPLVEELSPGNPFMSIRDICDTYNVSIYTAKSALSYFIERGMLEHRQGAGTFRKNPMTHAVVNIGLVASYGFDPFSNLYFGEITRRASKLVFQRNHGLLLLGGTDALPDDGLVAFLRSRLVTGLLLMGVFNESFVRRIEEVKFPAVFCELQKFETSLDYIVAEDPEDSYRLVKHLLDLGHRHIGFMEYPEGDDVRKQSYFRAMGDAGIEPPPTWIHRMPSGNMESGAAGAAALTQQAPELTAIFCKNDTTAVGAITYLKSTGKRVPQDISIVGFDGIPLGEQIDPSLTTVKIDRAAVGENLVKLLYRRIQSPDVEQKIVRLHGEFIERNSCAAPRQET